MKLRKKQTSKYVFVDYRSKVLVLKVFLIKQLTKQINSVKILLDIITTQQYHQVSTLRC